MWISETVRQRNKRTRPGFEVPVISKLTGMNQKSENVTHWRPIQMCSLWSVICICRTGLPDDLLELSKHLEEVKEEVSWEIISTSRVIWSVWVTTKQIFMLFVHKICRTRFLLERHQESSPANEMKFRLILISFYIWGQKYNIIILAKLSVVGGGGATTDG